MRLSARNMLKGKVTTIMEGIITAEVKIDIEGGYDTVPPSYPKRAQRTWILRFVTRHTPYKDD